MYITFLICNLCLIVLCSRVQYEWISAVDFRVFYSQTDCGRLNNNIVDNLHKSYNVLHRLITWVLLLYVLAHLICTVNKLHLKMIKQWFFFSEQHGLLHHDAFWLRAEGSSWALINRLPTGTDTYLSRQRTWHSPQTCLSPVHVPPHPFSLLIDL